MPQQYHWSAETVAQRLNETKQRIESGDPSLNKIFTQTFFDDLPTQLNQLNSTSTTFLSGAIISIKDLFDVEGYVTKAGTKFMSSDSPAAADAEAIAKLRSAGAILIGHTTMTELAYSGLGLNPHYGTPDNALTPGCIPGGSTSGGAVSVALHIADIAVGTDTGGSLRIPAAFNGIVGFKPTQKTVSRQGCKTLSHSLDSVGPIARSAATCELAYRTMKNGLQPVKELSNTLVIPANYGMDDLDSVVSEEFNHAVSSLECAGFNVERRSIDALEELKSLAIWQLAAVESRSEYDSAYQTCRDKFDPRVASRLSRADEVDAITYRKTLSHRNRLIDAYAAQMGNHILLMPSVPIMPPKLSDIEADDEEYYRVNLQVLRNPTIANVLDCCSISLPFKSGENTIGVMLTATALHDYSLLSVAKSCEKHFNRMRHDK